MMTILIVLVAIVLAGLYLSFWVFKREFREQVEKPKYKFIKQIKASESQLNHQKNHNDKPE